jgi:hypothetical protein
VRDQIAIAGDVGRENEFRLYHRMASLG